MESSALLTQLSHNLDTDLIEYEEMQATKPLSASTGHRSICPPKGKGGIIKHSLGKSSSIF